jgi:hypothetical protein
MEERTFSDISDSSDDLEIEGILSNNYHSQRVAGVERMQIDDEAKRRSQ